MQTGEQVIVCGVDGSAAGQRALVWAVDEAAQRKARVRAVTTWSWDGIEQLGAEGSSAAARERARRGLDKAVDSVIGEMEDPPVVERVCEQGVPSEALCAAAADAVLVVLGSHGHGAVRDRLVGSTSERVIHHAPCPVVVVPDPRHVEKNVKRARESRREIRSLHSVPFGLRQHFASAREGAAAG